MMSSTNSSKIIILLLLLPFLTVTVTAFTPTATKTKTNNAVDVSTLISQRIKGDALSLSSTQEGNHNSSSEDILYQPPSQKVITQRRQFLSNIATTCTVSATTATIISSNPMSSWANDATFAMISTTTEEAPVVAAPAAVVVKNTIEMKTFVDPKGLFAINVPKRFFAIRRTVKGDLPDETTGKGRRGSSIFTAGDMAKAEVVAIERFPTKVLLEEEGIIATGDLSTFPSIGNPIAIANLIALRRDRDKNAQARTIVVPNSVSVSDDGKTLYFSLEQSIDVQKPELLMEQTGMSELIRITKAKATLNSNDGQMMAVFASALQQDYAADDGPALLESVNSFVALDQSSVKGK